MDINVSPLIAAVAYFFSLMKRNKNQDEKKASARPAFQIYPRSGFETAFPPSPARFFRRALRLPIVTMSGLPHRTLHNRPKPAFGIAGNYCPCQSTAPHTGDSAAGSFLFGSFSFAEKEK